MSLSSSPFDGRDSAALALQEARHALAKLDTHEAVCAERFNNIKANTLEVKSKVERLEKIMIGTSGALILGMAGVLIKILMLR